MTRWALTDLSDGVLPTHQWCWARVAALALSGEVLVSGTVKDLVAGSGLSFQERGVQLLKGIPGEWQLFAVAR